MTHKDDVLALLVSHPESSHRDIVENLNIPPQQVYNILNSLMKSDNLLDTRNYCPGIIIRGGEHLLSKSGSIITDEDNIGKGAANIDSNSEISSHVQSPFLFVGYSRLFQAV